MIFLLMTNDYSVGRLVGKLNVSETLDLKATVKKDLIKNKKESDQQTAS